MICYSTFNRYNQLNQEENKTYYQKNNGQYIRDNKLYYKDHKEQYKNIVRILIIRIKKLANKIF